ncbi:MAG TPA: peptidoglycan-binding protein, partial [Rubrivivax sp.]|nr:peptidoglycan-binding protein [Rubrivivax sp.]
TEAVIFSGDELLRAPRIVAAQEGYVTMSQGQLAYVLGELGPSSGYRLFREPQPLHDFDTRELLGYEARYVGTAEFVRPGDSRVDDRGQTVVVPATVSIQSVRMEAGVGDRLAPLPARDLQAYAPHHPSEPMSGRVLQIYGDALSAGQNQIVALNRGERDGVERGHVLALWRQGDRRVKQIDGQRTELQLPNEQNGLLFVFSVFERTSYALILSVNVPVFPGDAFTQP